MSAGQLLIIDDEPSLRMLLRAVLEEEGWRVLEAGTAREGVQVQTDSPSPVVLLDLRLPDMDGLSVLPKLLEIAPETSVILLTAHGTVHTAVSAMKDGAFDYLTKPADNEEILAVTAKALAFHALRRENADLRARVGGGVEHIIGQSPAIRRIRELISQIAPTEASVVILGESGTGKELVAEAIHDGGRRAKGPLVKVNCAALPAELLESELFGYVRGAFTGAVKDKPGRFQLAIGGTLFLDEIGDLPLPLQPKLLRALQEGCVEPLGGVRPVPTDVRIVAATHKNLEQEVEAGRFRRDLYFRLNVLEVVLPPLRERIEDLPLLVSHFLTRLAAKNGRPVPSVTPRFLELLARHAWPGNIRELINVLERALILSRTRTLGPEALPPQLRQSHSQKDDAASGSSHPPTQTLEELERQRIRDALKEHGGHREKTADALGISRRTLQYKLRKFGLLEREGG